MNTSELIVHLRSRKAVLNVLDGKLKIMVSEKIMTPEIVKDITSHKPEIIDYLKAANHPKKFAYHLALITGELMTIISERSLDAEYRQLNATIYKGRIKSLELNN